jgi:crotonobetainyl-CoA:carnitine CoA-transferase CaiB-like acyl-CoA transferase
MSPTTTSTLTGIRVLDLSSLVAGPYCTMSLGDWGADVIKVEPPGGEASRRFGPAHAGGLTATALAMNRGKRSLEVDLHDPDEIETMMALVRDSDVLVHNMLPGLTQRIGFAEERLRAANPRLIIVRISGFGDGPDRDRPGLDPVFQAAAGMMSMNGERSGGPLRVGPPVVDVAAGMLAASAVLLGLLQRQQTGIGTTTTLSMVEIALALQAGSLGNYFFDGEQPPRLGNASHFTLTDTYRTRDGHVVVSVISERAWADFCAILGAPDLEPSDFPSNESRLEHRDHLHELIERVLMTDTTAHWAGLLAARRVPYSPVQEYRDAVEYAARQNAEVLVRTVEGESNIVTIANPVRLTGYPGRPSTHPPRVGQHTAEILSMLSANRRT